MSADDAAQVVRWRRTGRARANRARRRRAASAAQARAAGEHTPPPTFDVAQQPSERPVVSASARARRSRNTSRVRAADGSSNLRLRQRRIARALIGAHENPRGFSSFLAVVRRNRCSESDVGEKGTTAAGRSFLEHARLVTRRRLGARQYDGAPLHLSQPHRGSPRAVDSTCLRARPKSVGNDSRVQLLRAACAWRVDSHVSYARRGATSQRTAGTDCPSRP